MKNNRNVTFVSRPCFDNMFHVIYAHEWMNNAQVHEMQVQLCKQNTRGVTALKHFSSKRVNNNTSYAELRKALIDLGIDLTGKKEHRRWFQ